jgi:hypothetical protein
MESLIRYEPDLSEVKGIGFCVTIPHAKYMAQMFNDRGIRSAALVPMWVKEIVPACSQISGRESSSFSLWTF